MEQNSASSMGKSAKEDANVRLPLYAKLVLLLVGVIAFGFLMVVCRPIIVPLLFSLIIAILLNPLVNAMHRRGANRPIAILAALLLAMVMLISLGYFIATQLMQLQDQLPAFREKFAALMISSEQWITARSHMAPERMHGLLQKLLHEGASKGGSLVGSTITLVGGMFGFLFLLPVYTFLFLFYKRLLLEFFARLFPRREHDTVADVLGETKVLVQSYLMGLLIEAGIIASLNTMSLWVIGVPYALVLGVIGALLNMIPYIGGIIAIALPMVLAFTTLQPIAALWVLIAYVVVQFIDNHFIVPRIVASRVQVNALVAIVAVLAGGAIWGVAGMFLSLPLTAIVKVIFDRVPELAPFGYVLGDDEPLANRVIFMFPTKPRKVTGAELRK